MEYESVHNQVQLGFKYKVGLQCKAVVLVFF